MKAVPGYGKILTIGSAMTENALVGNIAVQEKLDGSLFGFGINEYAEMVMRSKGAMLTEDNHAQMFDEAVEFMYNGGVGEKLRLHVPTDTYFYCEYLQKPKHNTLKYEKTPKNHLMLFDVLSKGKYVNRKDLVKLAEIFDIDVVPELWSGNVLTYVREKNVKGFSSPLDLFKRIIETTTSYLGGEIVEGVVVKNYDQTIMLGGQVFPLFTKYVRESFKERHEVDWKIRQPKNSLQDYILGFKSEARWQKSVIHLREKGLLTQSPKDIGPLIKVVQEDIKEEEEQNIKNYLYKCFIEDIERKAVWGLPEWYKNELLKNLK